MRASTDTPSNLAISAVRSSDGRARPFNHAQTALRPTPKDRASWAAGMRPIALARFVAKSSFIVNRVQYGYTEVKRNPRIFFHIVIHTGAIRLTKGKAVMRAKGTA